MGRPIMFAVRIAFLTLQWPGVRMGGIGAAVKQNALALAGAGHDVHVFTLAMPKDADRPGNLTIHEADDLSALVNRSEIPGAAAISIHAGGEGVYRLSLAWRLCQKLIESHRELRFDVVEAPEVEALGLPLLINSEFDAPVVTQLHCCTALAAKMNRSSGRDQTLAALEFAAIHLSDGVIAPTRAVVEATRELIPVRDDVSVIPHCFANAIQSASPVDGPVVFVGRLERLKGVEVIALALNIFLKNCPEARFRFIGPDTTVGDSFDGTPSPTFPRDTEGGKREVPRHWSESSSPATGIPGEGWGGGQPRQVAGGSMRDRLLSILNDDIRGRVEFTGEVSATEISNAWREACFGVMPSLWENFSIAAGEAMSHGRALIVADGTGSVELVGNAGIIVPPGDAEALAVAMQRLWTDRKLLARLSRAAFNRVSKIFSPERTAEQREAYYAELIRQFLPSERLQRLQSLPASIASELFPALVRMTGSLAACPSASANTPGARLLNIMNRIEDEQGQPARLMLYGAGKHTAKLMSERHLWESKQHRVVGIIDDHPRFAQTPVYLDVPVQSMNTAAARVLGGEKLPPVVLSTDTYADQLWQQSAPLRAAGVQVFRLY